MRVWSARAWLAAGVLLSVFGAAAAEEHKVRRTVDMTQVLLDDIGRPAADVSAREGKEEDDPRCAKCPRLTLGRAVAQALFAAFPEDRDQAEQKWARAALAQRIKADPKATLTAEEVAVIKRQLGRAFGGVLLMQAYPLLDPNAKPPEVK